MMGPALVVEKVSKRYRLHRDRPVTLRELFSRLLGGSYERSRELWALRDVSFTLERGRSLGVIGHNGAGKSTLLRLLSGVGRPTTGRIHSAGQVSGLLELGGGFQHELSGRENILTVGLLSGLSEREVKEREAEIIAFAELEDAIDQPMRTYSSGMYMRLAFAVATRFDPAILVLDEVLAVGDARFQAKCGAHFAQAREAGKTLIVASHAAEQIQTLCDEVLVLEEGRVVLQGEPDAALRCYEALMRQRTQRRVAGLDHTIAAPAARPAPAAGGSREGTYEATIETVRIHRPDGFADVVRSGDGLAIELDYSLHRPLRDLAFSLGIYTETHVKCFDTYVPSAEAVVGSLGTRGTLCCLLPSLPLLPQRYYVNVGLYPCDHDYVYDYHWKMHPFDVLGGPGAALAASGIVALAPAWSVTAHG